jgi:hypothetical protein
MAPTLPVLSVKLEIFMGKAIRLDRQREARWGMGG